MPRVSTITFTAQGLILIGNAVFGIVNPRAAADSFQLSATPNQALTMMSTLSLGLGSCYMWAAYKGDRGLMKLTIVGRTIGTAVFAQAGGPLRAMAMYEAGITLFTGLVLWWERDTRSKNEAESASTVD